MNRQEIGELLAQVRLCWANGTLGGDTREVVATWHALLGQFTYEEGHAAVLELAATGREFPPPPGVVVKQLSERKSNIPEWDAAWSETDRLIRRFGRYAKVGPSGRELGPPPPEAFSHPAIAAWAIPEWRELCMAPAPGVNGHGTFMAQSREVYNARRARAIRDRSLDAVGAAREPVLSPGGAELLPPPSKFGDVLKRLTPPDEAAA